MQIISIKANNSSREVLKAEAGVGDGVPTIIKANKGLNFQLFDESTNKSPSHVVTKRSGDDLFISVEKNSPIADIVIEGFYSSDSMLIGVNEQGKNFYYVSNSGEISDLVTELDSGEVSIQVLGGSEQPTPYWVGAASQPAEAIEGSGSMLPWLAGIGLVGGGIAIASSNDDSSSHKKTDDTPSENTVGAVDVAGTNNTEDKESASDEVDSTNKYDESEPQAEQNIPSDVDESTAENPNGQQESDKNPNNEAPEVADTPEVSVEDKPKNVDDSTSELEGNTDDKEIHDIDSKSDDIGIGDVLTDYKPKQSYSLSSNDESIDVDLVDSNTESRAVYESNADTSDASYYVYSDAGFTETANLTPTGDSVII